MRRNRFPFVLTAAALFAVFALVIPATAQKVNYDEFAKTVEQSIRIGDTRRLERTIKENPTHAMGHFRALVLQDLRNQDGANADVRAAFIAAWKGGFDGSDTLEQLDRWLQTASADVLRTYESTRQALNRCYGELDRLQNGAVKERKAYTQLRDTLMQVVQAFDTIGYPVDAADAWGLLSRVYNAMPERTIADRKDAVYAVEQFLAKREVWNYTGDQYYPQNKGWLIAEKERIADDEKQGEKREEEGYKGDVKGVDAYLMPDADKAEVIADLTFEPVTKPKPDYVLKGNSVGPEWFTVRVLNTGPAKLDWFAGGELYMVRPGASDFGITLDGSEPDLKKNKYTEVEASNRLKKPAEFHLDAAGRLPYAMWFFVGSGQEQFLGISQNLAPYTDSSGNDAATVYFKSAASWTTEAFGEEIVFYDDNTDGKLFVEDPFAVRIPDRHIGAGPDQEVMVPSFDGMKVGKRGAVQPLSTWHKFGDGWYHLRAKDTVDGRKVGFRPANPEYLKTGTVKLDWDGPRGAGPMFLLIRGQGDFEGAVFDLADGKPHEVPVGEYLLAFGRIESGKGARLMSANIFPGAMGPIAVEDGKEAVVKLGAPFHIDFEAERMGDSVKIDPTKIRIRGAGGEIYTHLNGAVPEAEVVSSKADNGKGARPVGELVPIPDSDTLNRIANKVSTLGMQVGYYPMAKGATEDPTLTVEVPEGQFVGIREKKNALLGPLEPVWK